MTTGNNELGGGQGKVRTYVDVDKLKPELEEIVRGLFEEFLGVPVAPVPSPKEEKKMAEETNTAIQTALEAAMLPGTETPLAESSRSEGGGAPVDETDATGV